MAKNRTIREEVGVMGQKLDDLKETMDRFISVAVPALAAVPVHEERLSWVKKHVAVLYSGIGVVMSGAVAYWFEHR